MAVPGSARALSGALGLIVAYLQIVPGVQAIATDPIVAAGHLLLGVPFFALFAWIAVWPGHADVVLRRRLNVDLSDTSELVGGLVHVVFVFIVFGSTVLATTQGLSTLLETGEHPAIGQQLTGQGVVFNLLLNLVLFVVAATTWLILVDGLDLDGVVRALGLELDRFPRALIAGILTTLGVLVALAALAVGLQQLGLEPENPQADAIASALTPTTAILVAALAGLGEEIYFRGFLLERVGNFWQAAFFGALHATYLTTFQVLLPFLLGLAFGWLTRREGLWGPIVAHTAFNALALISAIYGEDIAGIVALLG